MIKLCECGCGNPAPIASKTSTKEGYIKGQPRRFILGHHLVGKKPPLWNGGRNVKIDGRIRIWNPEHLRADKQGYVQEHILIAEKALGKSLPIKAVIHHVNNNPGDNFPNNLVICQDNAYHKLIHRRTRAFAACGHASWRKCVHCKKYDSPENLTICGNTIYHKYCEKTHGQKRRIKCLRK